MTERQKRGLREVWDGPRRLPAATGEALVRRGYAERRHGGRYAITEEGRGLLRRLDRKSEEERMTRLLDSEEKRGRYRRALDWIRFVGALTDNPGAMGYVRVAILAEVVEETAPPSGISWGEKGDRVVREHAAHAVQTARDFEVMDAAGGAITVEFQKDRPPSPVKTKALRREAIDAAAAEDGIVSLQTYRERRG